MYIHSPPLVVFVYRGDIRQVGSLEGAKPWCRATENPPPWGPTEGGERVASDTGQGQSMTSCHHPPSMDPQCSSMRAAAKRFANFGRRHQPLASFPPCRKASQLLKTLLSHTCLRNGRSTCCPVHCLHHAVPHSSDQPLFVLGIQCPSGV